MSGATVSMERGCNAARSGKGVRLNRDRGNNPSGGWSTMRIRVVTAIESRRRRNSSIRAASASNTAAGRRSMPVDPSNR